MSTGTNPEAAFPFALLEKPHSEESWAGSLLPRGRTGSQSCRRECGAVNPCLTWVLLPRAPVLPAWLFSDASSVFCHGVPLCSGCLFPPTGEGRLGWEPELVVLLGDAAGILWELKFPSVTALRPGKHQLRPEGFCPSCLLSLQERQRETASCGSRVVENCGQKFC